MKSANHFPKIVLTGGSGFLGYNLLNNKVFQDALDCRSYFLAIFITIWAVIFPGTKIAWIVFKNLPESPLELKKALKFI